MSEIYLTKIERKTIFTKSLIFVLIMFVISDLTITGPFYFNFVPWLYLVGTIGSLKKIDSILMCVIGTFTVFIASLIMQGGFAISCLVSTLIALILLVLGIITGKMLFEFVLEYRLVKYIKPSKKTVYIISIIVMLLVSFVIVGSYYGNAISYLISKGNIKEYITANYKTDEFKIVSTKYSKQVVGNYIYDVEMDGQVVSFVPVSNKIFKDANLLNRLEKMNLKLKDETIQMTQSLLEKHDIFGKAQAEYLLEYTKFGVNPDTIVLNIKCGQIDADLDKLYKQLSNYINEIIQYKLPDKVVISINDDSLQINSNNIKNITAQYIKGGFEVKEISE